MSIKIYHSNAHSIDKVEEIINKEIEVNNIKEVNIINIEVIKTPTTVQDTTITVGNFDILIICRAE